MRPGIIILSFSLTVLTALTASAAAPADSIFRTEPYLQNPVGGGITVMWQTWVPAYSWVEYGTDTTDTESWQQARTIVDGQVICNGTQNKIRIEGLEPGRTYYYRVCSREILLYQAYKKEFGETAVSPMHSFTLPSDDCGDFTALIFNDLHKHSETLQALYSHVRDIPYDFVVFNGDCIDDPASHDEATAFLSELNSTVGAADVPVFYLRGNHEIRNAYSIGLRELFDYVGNRTYGAFNWGDTRIVMLDCGEDKPDDHWVYYGLNDFTGLRREQVDFLRQELKSKAFKKADRRILINHIPIWNNSDKFAPCTELWAPLLKKASFDLNVCAHVHSYGFWTAGAEDNPCPVVRGGGPSMKKATMIVLEKRGDELTMRAVDTAGRTIERQIL